MSDYPHVHIGTGGESEELKVSKTTAAEYCRWVETEDGQWETLCGNVFELSEGSPTDNDMAFCCYCGRTLKEVRFVEKRDE